MAHIVDLLGKHQRMIILGAALGVISLYIIPFDQIGNALSGDKLTGISNAIQHIQDTQNRISNNENIPDAAQDRIYKHLGDVIDHLTSVYERISNL
jgi:hypothetical protein